MASERSIGFIGLGEMGGPISRRLRAQGCSLVGYDADPRALERAVSSGAAPASSPKDVAARSRFVLLSLPTSREVEAVCLGPEGIAEGAARGTVVIDLTSGNPPDTIRIGRSLAERGIQMLDAGISGEGGTAGAASLMRGRLTVVAGGDDDLFAQCRPILELFSDKVFHVGPSGGGHLTKALLNFLNATTLLATAEAMVVATKAGLDPATVVAALNVSGGRSFSTERRFPMFVLKGSFGPESAGRLRYLLKDLRQAVEAGRALEVPMIISGLIHGLLSAGVASFGPDVASTNAMRLYEQWAKVEVRERAELGPRSAAAAAGPPGSR